MPSPNSTFTEIVTTTLREHKKELTDNISKNNALLCPPHGEGQDRRHRWRLRNRHPAGICGKLDLPALFGLRHPQRVRLGRVHGRQVRLEAVGDPCHRVWS